MNLTDVAAPQLLIIKWTVIVLAVIGLIIFIVQEGDKVENAFDTLFGIPTKDSLTKQVEADKQVITTEKQVNSGLVKTINKDVQEAQIVDNVTAQNKTNTIKIFNIEKTIDTQRQQDIAVVENNDKDKPVDVMDQDVSKVQITSIWKNYCSFNQNPVCSTL